MRVGDFIMIKPDVLFKDTYLTCKHSGENITAACITSSIVIRVTGMGIYANCAVKQNREHSVQFEFSVSEIIWYRCIPNISQKEVTWPILIAKCY